MSIEECTETRTSARQQYLVTIAANLLVLSQGCAFGWIAPALQILSSNKTPLSSALTNSQVSWVGSINSVGGLVGSLFFGCVTSMIGSKKVVLLLAFPFMIYWILIYFATSFYHILLARFISGWVGGGVQCTVVLFVSEIANDDIRGRLGSVSNLIRHIGILAAFIVGPSVEYKYVPIIFITIPITFAIIFMSIPNTPRYYLQKGKEQKAEKALCYYKGHKRKHQFGEKAIYQELERLKTITDERKSDSKIKMSDFCTRSSIRGMGIGFALLICIICTATFEIMSYAVIIFEKAGTSINPNMSSIILVLALICGSLMTTFLADRLGRKLMCLISTMGAACGLSATALFQYFSTNGYDLSSFAWVPVVSLSFVIFIASAGIVPISLICCVENLPPKIRTYGMSIINSLTSLAGFGSNKIFPILLESLGIHGCFTIYAICSVIAFNFILFVLKETSGQSLDDVGSKVKSKPIETYTEKSINV